MDKTEEDYQEAKRKYIKDWVEGGKSKDWAEASFEEKYPTLRRWNAKTMFLNGYGEQEVIDKLNEVIAYINNGGIKQLDTEDKSELKSMLEATLR